MKVLGASGQRIVRRKNPKRTRVSRCVKKVKRRGGVRSPVAVCQKATRQSYRTGRRLKRHPPNVRRANPLHFHVAFKSGPPIAIFRSMPRATQYAQALADRSGRAVRVYA
jgi:hypothetical protein